MDLISYLEIARRRWLVIVLACVLAVGATWFTRPTQAAVERSRTYDATATLVVNPTLEIPPNLAALALFATVGDVPERAADRLGWEGHPQALAATVTASANPETGTLTLSRTGTDDDEVARTVNVFAEELIAFTQDDARRDAQQQIRDIERRLQQYAQRIEATDRLLRADPTDTALLVRRESLQTVYQGLIGQTATLQDQLSVPPSLDVLQEAVALGAGTAVVSAPTTTPKRMLVGAGLGLLLGLALALFVERFDSRLRTRDRAEQAFQLPVLAEIPPLSRQQRQSHEIVSSTQPGSTFAEGYRALRSAVLLLRPDPQSAGALEGAGGQGPQVIMVTSARAQEGKTSTVANLAVVLAESGRRVVVLSLDFRNPHIHEYFDVEEGRGLSDLLAAGRPQDLAKIMRKTGYAGVRLATSGTELGHPGALLAGVGALISQARELADVVLIDTAPLLAVSDAVDLSPHVDAAIVVSRVSRTTAAQAAATQRLLTRLRVPALGAVLIGSQVSLGNYPHAPVLARLVASRSLQRRPLSSTDLDRLSGIDRQESRPRGAEGR